MSHSASADDDPSLPIAGSDRLVWIDAAKGQVIVLVVFGHRLGGVLSRGWLDPNVPRRRLYDYLQPYHLPIFFEPYCQCWASIFFKQIGWAAPFWQVAESFALWPASKRLGARCHFRIQLPQHRHG